MCMSFSSLLQPFEAFFILFQPRKGAISPGSAAASSLCARGPPFAVASTILERRPRIIHEVHKGHSPCDSVLLQCLTTMSY